MSKIYSVLIFFFFAGAAFGQESNSLYRDSFPGYHAERIENTSSVVNLTVNTIAASNFLSRDLVLKNYWTTDIIDDQINKLKSLNNAGFELSVDLRYSGYNRTLFGNENLSPFIGVSTSILGGLRFNDEVVKVILEGNSSNRDISLNDGKNRTDFIQYSSFYFGISKKNSSTRINASLNFLVGNQRQSAQVRSGRVLTHESGERVDIENIDFTLESTAYSPLEGWGFATTLELRKQMNRGILLAQLTDFGLINWQNLETIEPRNKALTYEGFDLTGIWDNDFSVDINDSIDGNYLIRSEDAAWRLTPFYFNTRVIQPLNDFNFYEVGISYRRISGFMPMLSIAYGQYFKKQGISRWKAGIDAGGFGMMALKLQSDLSLGSNFGIHIQVRGAESFLIDVPINWSAQAGIFLSL